MASRSSGGAESSGRGKGVNPILDCPRFLAAAPASVSSQDSSPPLEIVFHPVRIVPSHEERRRSVAQVGVSGAQIAAPAAAGAGAGQRGRGRSTWLPYVAQTVHGLAGPESRQGRRSQQEKQRRRRSCWSGTDRAPGEGPAPTPWPRVRGQGRSVRDCRRRRSGGRCLCVLLAWIAESAAQRERKGAAAGAGQRERVRKAERHRVAESAEKAQSAAGSCFPCLPWPGRSSCTGRNGSNGGAAQRDREGAASEPFRGKESRPRGQKNPV